MNQVQRDLIQAVILTHGDRIATHYEGCYLFHVGCLAHRLRALDTEDPTGYTEDTTREEQDMKDILSTIEDWARDVAEEGREDYWANLAREDIISSALEDEYPRTTLPPAHTKTGFAETFIPSAELIDYVKENYRNDD